MTMTCQGDSCTHSIHNALSSAKRFITMYLHVCYLHRWHCIHNALPAEKRFITMYLHVRYLHLCVCIVLDRRVAATALWVERAQISTFWREPLMRTTNLSFFAYRILISGRTWIGTISLCKANGFYCFSKFSILIVLSELYKSGAI